jgi:hypothetical protein
MHHEKYSSLGNKLYPLIKSTKADLLWSPDMPFKRLWSGNLCALNSFWRPAVMPTWSMHYEKNSSLGDKLSSPSNKQQSGFIMVSRWAVLE